MGDLVKIYNGRDYKSLKQGNVPVYGTGGYMLSVDQYLSESDAIGIGRKGTIDRPFILRGPFWTVDTLFYCIPQRKDSLYFIFCLYNKISWKRLDESSGVPSLSKHVISKVPVKVPSALEQMHIGQLVDKIDQSITLHHQESLLLKKVKSRFMSKVFSMH